MLKKLIPLVIAAGLVSALLLFVGTAVMGQFSPAFASSMPALFAGGRTVEKGAQAAESISQRLDVSLQVDGSQLSQDGSPAVAASLVATAEVKASPEPSQEPDNTPVAVTIAELLADPAAFLDKVVSLTGIATILDDSKILLNDGTGQIIIDLEDDMKITVVDGSTLTIVGKFDDSGDMDSVEIEACTIEDQNGVTVVDDDCGNDDDDDGDDDHGGVDDDDDGDDDDNGGVDDDDDDDSGVDDDDDDNGGDDDGEDDGEDDGTP